MIKSELVQQISTANPHLYQRERRKHRQRHPQRDRRGDGARRSGGLRGFGAFSVKNRPARTGAQPRTGACVGAQKSVPFFKTGKEMRERLNKSGAAIAATISLRMALTMFSTSR